MGRYQWDMYHDPNLYGDRIIMNYRYSDYIRWDMLRSYIFLIIYIQFITVIVPKKTYIPFYYSVYQSIDDPPIPIFSSEIYQPAMYVFQAENLGI